jgi:hypothetical protein
MINGIGMVNNVAMTTSTIQTFAANALPSITADISNEVNFIVEKVHELKTDGALLLMPNNALVRGWANVECAQEFVNFMTAATTAGNLNSGVSVPTIIAYVSSNDWLHMADGNALIPNLGYSTITVPTGFPY